LAQKFVQSRYAHVLNYRLDKSKVVKMKLVSASEESPIAQLRTHPRTPIVEIALPRQQLAVELRAFGIC
jgi:hypothetical protein